MMNTLTSEFKLPVLLQAVIESSVDGILILTDQQDCVYANQAARQICAQFNQSETNRTKNSWVPESIWQACESLVESREWYTNQLITIELEVATQAATAYRVRTRWLELEVVDRPCFLVTLEDKQQSTKSMVITEVQKYGLTPREAKVWLLYRADYTYKKIASELYITLNTVKKHMKSIHAKRKAVLCEE